MRRFSKAVPVHLLSGWLAWVTLAAFAATAAAADRPNFVFVYADDWRWDCLGVVQREQGEKARFPWLQTPRLDELASQSVRFNQSFVVNSLCSPGRACVLTGRYNHLNGIIGNGRPMPLDTATIATQLKETGYKTAYCGKWHMDGQRERPGFDYVASFVGQGRYFDCPIIHNGRQTPTKGWIDDVSTDYAIDFLEGQPQTEPFFLFLGFKSPHGPRGGENLPERVRELYADDQSRSVPNVDVTAIYRQDGGEGKGDAPRKQVRQFEGHRAYMRHITAIDHCVGRLLDAIERTGHADNTIVIVTSDNGYYLGEHGLGDKRTAYEESIRVPLMFRLPVANAPRGAVNDDALVLNIDYAATILDLAGANPLAGSQGRSLRPLLAGETPADWRTAFFYEYFKEGQYEAPTVLAARTANHKLIVYPGHDEWTEVFDLAADPYETTNLVDNRPLLEKMRRVFDEQSEAVEYRMPEEVGESRRRVRRASRNRLQRPNRAGEVHKQKGDDS